MSRSQQQIENICRKLLEGYIGDAALNVTLDEFQEFHAAILRLTEAAPEVSFVNLETIVVAQFSSVSPQHFDIVDDEPLTEDRFDFVSKRHWYGRRDRPQGFMAFLWAEFLLNFSKLLSIFTVSATLLFLVNSDPLYELVASFLIQSATVFLSLYIIFTVAQSQSLFQDISLFRKGILQKYYTDDRNVTLLGILTIAMTFLNTGLVYALNSLESWIQGYWVGILARLIKAVFTAFVITLLFDTFFAVANYYLYRNRDVLERDITSDVLDSDYRKFGMNN